MILFARIAQWFRPVTSSTTQLGMQDAVQWWNTRRCEQLQQEAKKIQDGLLQELFILRRRLELLSFTNALAEQEDFTHYQQEELLKIEKIQHKLMDLGDRLCPPYLEESFPLAIQHRVEQWKLEHPEWRLSLELLKQWNHESWSQSQSQSLGQLSQQSQQQSWQQKCALVNILDELLLITAPGHVNIAIQLPQKQQSIDLNAVVYDPVICDPVAHLNHVINLSIQITYVSETALETVLQNKALSHLYNAYELLVAGCYSLNRKPQTLTWYFSWSPR